MSDAQKHEFVLDEEVWVCVEPQARISMERQPNRGDIPHESTLDTHATKATIVGFGSSSKIFLRTPSGEMMIRDPGSGNRQIKLFKTHDEMGQWWNSKIREFQEHERKMAEVAVRLHDRRIWSDGNTTPTPTTGREQETTPRATRDGKDGEG